MKTFAKDKLFLCHHKNFNITFHPKAYLFGNKHIEKVFIGSSNLTTGGLYLNYEANIAITLSHSYNAKIFQKQISNYWKYLLDDENTKECTNLLLRKLLEEGIIFDEIQQKQDIIEKILDRHLPFKSKKLKKIPPLIASTVKTPKFKQKFAMILSKFDVSERSQDPIILIPITALKSNPVFWSFPNFYTYSNTGYPQFYTTANVNIDDKTFKNQIIRLYYYNNKKEFRLQCEVIKRKGHPGDIVIIKKKSIHSLEFDIELLRHRSKKFKAIRPLLTYKASSQKFFTYY